MVIVGYVLSLLIGVSVAIWIRYAHGAGGGVGGGFAIVPALVLLGNVPMKQAIGSSLLIISGWRDCWAIWVKWHWISLTFWAGVGVVLGAYVAQWVSAQWQCLCWGRIFTAGRIAIDRRSSLTIGFLSLG